MSKNISFGSITIGEDLRPVTIAEAAVEHLGSVEVAMRMADTALSVGADIIKFQMHLPSEEMIPDTIKFWGGSLDEILERYNLSIDDHRVLIDYCQEIGIQYLCTPFCPEAVDVLADIGVDAFKTGSGEMTNLPMFERIVQIGLPVLVSTGMSTEDEITSTVNYLKYNNAEFMIMNCTSIYPAPYESINLRLIPEYKNRFDLLVGHSDHTPDIWTALGAVSLGAKVIEKHFTLNRQLLGPDSEVSLEPNEFKSMSDGIKKIYAALGSDKTIHEKEVEVRNWAHHSVVSVVNIPKGSKLTIEMLKVKRPGTGIPAKHIKELVNLKTTKEIKANSVLNWDDVSDSA